VPHAEQEMGTLPEHLILPLVSIVVNVVLSFVFFNVLVLFFGFRTYLLTAHK